MEICEDSTCVAAILSKAMKASSAAAGHAVTTLWSVCYLFRDQKAQEAVMKANSVTDAEQLFASYAPPQI